MKRRRLRPPSKAKQGIKKSWELISIEKMNQDIQKYHWPCHIAVSRPMKESWCVLQWMKVKSMKDCHEHFQHQSRTVAFGKMARNRNDALNQIQGRRMSSVCEAATERHGRVSGDHHIKHTARTKRIQFKLPTMVEHKKDLYGRILQRNGINMIPSSWVEGLNL